MTWSARVTRPDGTNPAKDGAEDYQACQSCKHGGFVNHPPCYISRAGGSLGNILTSIDVGADGHMASGEALLKCNGYEPKD